MSQLVTSAVDLLSRIVNTSTSPISNRKRLGICQA